MNEDELTTTVAVTEAHVPAMSTIGYGHGIDTSNGDQIWFSGDHRPMRELAQALDEGTELTVELEPWQITRRIAPEVTQ